MEKELGPVRAVNVEESLSTKETLENELVSYCLPALLCRTSRHCAFKIAVRLETSSSLSQFHCFQSELPSG